MKIETILFSDLKRFKKSENNDISKNNCLNE